MANDYTETADQTALPGADGDREPLPGLLLVFSAGEPMSGALPLVNGKEIVLGRGALQNVDLRDNCMSRKHASVTRSSDHWVVRDLGSRNGTFVNGERVDGERSGKDIVTVRVGETVCLLLEDVRPFVEHGVETRDSSVVGVKMAGVLQTVVRAAQTGVLHITGETGSGKEVVARAFHQLGPGRTGPFVAVNCATIPEGVAERLLFGTKKGAFSGADRDATGYVQEANGGTLFLDEVGELESSVQAKLLRVLETREVLPLGASRPVRVELSLCSATHRDLRQSVAEGKFREDLFFRLGRPKVVLPPLRDRPEEIPFLIDRQLRDLSADLVAQAALVDTCMLRYWPGNVRELLVEIRDAAALAQAAYKTAVKSSFLAEDAGARYETGEPGSSSGGRVSVLPPPEEIEKALAECEGRVATAARKLGIHRNQLRRYLDKHPETKARYLESNQE